MSDIMSYFDRLPKVSGVETLVTTPPPKAVIIENLEEISNNGIEITLTFNEMLHNRYSPATLTAMVRTDLMAYKKRYKFSCIMVGEYSEVGRYHMHGSIRADGKMINSIKRKYPSKFGRVELKCIKYVQSWVQYVMKTEKSPASYEVGADLSSRYKDIVGSELIYI